MRIQFQVRASRMGKGWCTPGEPGMEHRGAHANGGRIVQVCDTVAELANGTYEDLGWPELLPFIFQCVQAGEPRLQESSLLIFAQLAQHLMGTLRQHMATLHGVLTRMLGSPSRDVALAAMRATAAFVQARAARPPHSNSS